MVNTYKKIIGYLEAGYFVEVKNSDDEFIIFSPFKDFNDRYRDTGRGSDLKMLRERIGAEYGDSKEDLKQWSVLDNWQITKVFLQPFTPYKVGQKVRLRDNNEIDTIEDTVANNFCYKLENHLPRHHFQLLPVFEDEEEDWEKDFNKKFSMSFDGSKIDKKFKKELKDFIKKVIKEIK